MTDQAIKLGILAWPQYTDWESLERAGQRVDELGFESLWTWDHLYPIVGDPSGPIFEGWLTLAGWAQVTKRATLGLMVGANTFRNPALVAKMATTLDHISGGRAVLGIGGAWFETEHTAYGLDFGSGFGERLDRLDEAVAIMRGMLHGERPSGSSVYATREIINNPPPVQAHLPILIGGGGEKKTLRTTAKYADAWNISGSPEVVKHKDEILRRHCEEVGRDHTEIERTLQGGGWILRDSLDEARRVAAEHARVHPGWRGPSPATPEALAHRLAGYVELGFRHIYFDYAAPWDAETLERYLSDVKPLVEERTGATARVGAG